MYQMPYNVPNDQKTYQHSPFQSPSKFTRIGIFGLKTNHLATLSWTDFRSKTLQAEEDWRIRSVVGRQAVAICYL
jgi:hypothetical protein